MESMIDPRDGKKIFVSGDLPRFRRAQQAPKADDVEGCLEAVERSDETLHSSGTRNQPHALLLRLQGLGVLGAI